MNPTTTPTVLVAEDDSVFRHLLQFTIARAGYNVIAVGDGEAAWQRLQLGDIDFLVTDHQMPRCSGLELIARMQQDSPWSQQQDRIILCTAKGLEIDRDVITRQIGVRAVMSKPFSPKQLVIEIDHVLRGQSTQTAPDPLWSSSAHAMSPCAASPSDAAGGTRAAKENHVAVQ